MQNLIKQYKSLNIFEKRWFWSKIIYISIFGSYSINLFVNPFYTSSIYYRIGVVTAIFGLSAYSLNIIYRSLSRQEREWKGIIVDPITQEEVLTDVS